MKTCKSCPYWVKGEMKLNDTAVGSCQFNPPVTTYSVGKHVITDAPVQNVQIQFPLTAEAQWCGQHPANKAPDLGVLE
jgi:hypothetical protein